MTQPRTARNEDSRPACAVRAGRTTAEQPVRETSVTTEAPTSIPHGAGLFEVAREGQDHAEVTNIRRLAGTEREPGSVLVTAGMALLAMLDGGLLYVVFAAQDRFIFSVKHQNVASMIQALALDVAMIIFSVLGLGLARRGLAASSERACIVVCALASAFMAWTASNPASFRSVAVYVSAPILLALTTDRTISVVRRHVLGMREDGSVWARLGRGIGLTVLYTLRLVVDLRATRVWHPPGNPPRGSAPRGPGARGRARGPGRDRRPPRGAGHGPGAYPPRGRGRPGQAGRLGGHPGRCRAVFGPGLYLHLGPDPGHG